MPLQRRLPKRGFHNPFRVETAIVNLEQLEVFPSGSEVTPALLVEKGLLRSKPKGQDPQRRGPDEATDD